MAPSQMRAIARLSELRKRGVIDEPMLTRSGMEDIHIEPLSIPDIGEIQNGTVPAGERDLSEGVKE